MIDRNYIKLFESNILNNIFEINKYKAEYNKINSEIKKELLTIKRLKLELELQKFNKKHY